MSATPQQPNPHTDGGGSTNASELVPTNGTPVVSTAQIAVAPPVKTYSDSEEGVMARWTSATQLMATSITATGDELAARISQALGEAELRTIDAPGRVIEVTDFLAHPITVINEEDGEISHHVRVVLFTSDGKRLSTCSGPACKMLAYLTTVWGPGPWSPPKLIEFFRHNRKGGAAGHYYTVEQRIRPVEVIQNTSKQPRK